MVVSGDVRAARPDSDLAVAIRTASRNHLLTGTWVSSLTVRLSLVKAAFVVVDR